ncbi:MAG: ribonuclease HII [Eubacteriales bacterium]|nr:ribonuclease HII [Eubacteriales bacterium]
MTDPLAYERPLLARGFTLIAGMDEVGRGPLAGPVAAAAVILPLTDGLIDGVDDSKKVSPKKREKLYEEIIGRAVAWSVALVDEKTIDEINILNATKLAMRRALEGLSVAPEHVLIDAVRLEGLAVPQTPIVKGDALSYSIAAASIVAKVTRDRLMCRWDEIYPGYGFASNKGYGSAAHIAALRELGPCPIHRRSFIGHFVKEDER